MRLVICVAVSIPILMAGCQKDEPCLTCPPVTPRITLDTILVESTEIDLRIATRDSTPLGVITMRRDTSAIFTSQIRSADTVIADDSLLPGHMYSYRAFTLSNASHAIVDSTRRIEIQTMDTTSHAFIWEVDTIGDGSSSVLFDVTFVSDSLAIAVGEIRVRDSLGNYMNPPYNMARWNGFKWTLETSFEPGYLYGELYTVCAFGPDDLWVGSTIPEHWNGINWTFYGVARGFPTGFRIRRIWGASTTNFYLIGEGGSIVHYDGRSWQRMGSGTDIDLTGASGTKNDNVWACGVDLLTGQRSIVLRFDGANWRTAYTYDPAHQNEQRPDSITGIVTSVYAPSDNRLWLSTSSGVYRCPGNTTGQGKLSWAPPYIVGLPWAIRGDVANNIFVAGDFGTIAHFNGQTWHHYQQFMNLNDSNAPLLHSVAVSGREVIIVGSLPNGKAIAYRGRRTI